MLAPGPNRSPAIATLPADASRLKFSVDPRYDAPRTSAPSGSSIGSPTSVTPSATVAGSPAATTAARSARVATTTRPLAIGTRTIPSRGVRESLRAYAPFARTPAASS
jgi:hypothetical protein